MNFLAHALLSFDNPPVLVGNMISDFVKGNKKFLYPDDVRKGIDLHRMIDRFTDDHPATAEAKTFFRPAYRLYSAPFVDVVYDHFLANDPNQFPDEASLSRFAEGVYAVLDENRHLFPSVFAYMFPYMKSQNWLFHYRTMEGIRNSMRGLVRRALYMNDPEPAFDVLDKNYDALNACYQDFFPDVFSYARESLSNLLAT